MIVSTGDCRWHAYADGQDAGIHDAAIFAHAAARTLHQKHETEKRLAKTEEPPKKKRGKK